jgi:hypothetical protein
VQHGVDITFDYTTSTSSKPLNIPEYNCCNYPLALNDPTYQPMGNGDPGGVPRNYSNVFSPCDRTTTPTNSFPPSTGNTSCPCATCIGMCGGVTPCLNGAVPPSLSGNASSGQPTRVPNLGAPDLGAMYGFSAIVVIPLYASVFVLSLALLLYSWWCTPARQHACAARCGWSTAVIDDSCPSEDLFPSKASGGGIGLSAEAASNLGWRDYADASGSGSGARVVYVPPAVSGAAAASGTSAGSSINRAPNGGSDDPAPLPSGAGTDAPMRAAHRWGALRQ